MNHPRAFGGAADGELSLAGFDPDRRLLDKGVGGHNCFCQLVAAVAGQDNAVNTGPYLFHGQGDANDAGAGHQNVLGRYPNAFADQPRHLGGVSQAFCADIGVGATAVDHHRAEFFPFFQSLLGEEDRGGFELSVGKDRRRQAGRLGKENGQVQLIGGSLIYSRAGGASEKTFGRCNRAPGKELNLGGHYPNYTTLHMGRQCSIM
ncbi:hypothetical protein ES703_39215 [subsurface metagenome]